MVNEECINDILLAIWNWIYKYDKTKGEFKNWFGVVARYKCISYQREYLNSVLIHEELDILQKFTLLMKKLFIIRYL